MIALPAAIPSSKFWPLRQSIRMIASTSPVPKTACRFPKNLSMAVPPFYRGAACDPVPVMQLCQSGEELHQFLLTAVSSDTASPFFSITGTWLSVKRKRSEEHTSELQSLMRISYAVFCLKKKNNKLNADI